MNAFQSELHERALAISKDFHRIEGDLIEILQKIDEASVYLELGYPSLFEYARSALSLSEGNAYAFTRISRKAKEVPVLKHEIRAGHISVSNAKQILPVLSSENQKEWIEKAKSLSKRELEKEIVLERPELAQSLKKKESVRTVGPERVSVRVELSEASADKIRRVQTLLSSSRRANTSIEEAIDAALDLFLEKKDPVKKAVRAIAKSDHEHFPRGKFSKAASNKRRPIPANIRHQVFKRDQGQCAYVSPNGKRCGGNYFIELHHRVPVSKGGANSLSNLVTLCGAHHRYAHRSCL